MTEIIDALFAATPWKLLVPPRQSWYLITEKGKLINATFANYYWFMNFLHCARSTGSHCYQNVAIFNFGREIFNKYLSFKLSQYHYF